ncbi:rho guanine nucleotide exchange factor 38 [Latimeria chalumnae]|uniref:rho guanine nucleotide exchange factor 38 n=1 Tax=Latimeria chalumnae TaxID=7897 RepID=UPI0003C18AF8|nr:PREDICTED: rho guanine nucleotide exchange factor 38 [Latimeria chalumnae]|eukprot:XP_006005279.1 PREDICTED: rho guanine nucleotide exchange factor 38 [Latimeria chalumnae]
MDTKEGNAKEYPGAKKKNLGFLRPRLYMLERRKTDSIIADNVDDSKVEEGNSGTLRRSQSDRTEYSHKLKEKMAPNSGTSAPVTPTLDPEERKQRMMAKRSKIINELIQTEKDYLYDTDLCLREVVQPLREKQIESLDVDGLFLNMESVSQISTKLLSMLEEATTELEPEMQIIGEVFLQIKTPLEEVYKIYCYHHDEAISLLESYEKDEDIKQHLRGCVQSLKKIYEEQGKPNLLDMGSLMIKPIQRVMKYPLLLCELSNATPECHPDYKSVKEAMAAVKETNTAINEFKRRKDLVKKYQRNDQEESLRGKFSRLNVRTIRKKSNRVTTHLKILTGGEPWVKDMLFDKEEKTFRSLEKAVRLSVKNVSSFLQNVQEVMSLAVQNVQELQGILQDTELVDKNQLQEAKNIGNPYEDCYVFLEVNVVAPPLQNKVIDHGTPGQGPCALWRASPLSSPFAQACASPLQNRRLEKLVLTPLTALQTMFAGPQKLIQKRYDKLLDYNSCPQRPAGTGGGEQLDLARRDYEALNAQLVEELQVFNQAAKKIVFNCLQCFIAILRELVLAALKSSPSEMQMPVSSSNVIEVQSRVMEELQNLNFVKENASTTQKLIERKLSLEKRKTVPAPPEVPHQTEVQRSKLISTYSAEKVYQAKRKFNAAQEHDVDLYEGELVAVVEQQDPLGSTSRWLVDTGTMQGYVYSSFLKQYNPAKAQNGISLENGFNSDDFDNISLFISARHTDGLSLRRNSSNASETDRVSMNGLQDKSETDGNDNISPSDADDQHIFYAVYAFEGRSQQELSLQEYQRVKILQFCDLSGNKEWWLAESNGALGYVPANYLGKMTYA